MDIQNNETIRETIRGFDGVWQRVTSQGDRGASCPGDQQDTSERTLRRLIREEQQAAHDDMCLARRLRGMPRMTLSTLADQARCRARSLKAEYFLDEGSCFEPETEDAPEGSCLCALREAYGRSCRLAEQYQAAAQKEESCALRALYRQGETENQRAAQTLRCMIVNSF